MESKEARIQIKRTKAEKMRAIKETKSKFIKIRCPKCKNEQIMFGKASTKISCLVCNKVLAEPTGGKSKVKARVLEVLE
jgi:small subunit ribosomal protein S27e